MPHIRLEQSNNITTESIDFNALFNEIHAATCEIAEAKMEDCQSRLTKTKDFYVGNGNEKNAFILLEIFLLTGRSDEAKKKLGETISKLLKKYYAEALSQLDVKLAVRIIEMQRDLYFKN